MDHPGQDMVAAHFRRSCETLDRAARDPALTAAILAIADTVTMAFRTGGKLLVAGNGGSAADAQHIAGEFLSRLNFDRNPLPAIALTTDSSVLTAIGNDYGYDKTFERQVRGLGRRGDVFVGISTSGRSSECAGRADGGAGRGPRHRRLRRRRRECDARPVRPLSRRAVRGDAADPAGSHRGRARDLRPGRARAVRCREVLIRGG